MAAEREELDQVAADDVVRESNAMGTVITTGAAVLLTDTAFRTLKWTPSPPVPANIVALTGLAS